MKKISFFFFIILISSCENNKKNIPINLDLINTHLPSIDNGRNIFNNYCSTCHLYGTGGATLINDKQSWSNLLKSKNIDEIYVNVIKGFIGKKGPMPSKGACNICTEKDLLDAINYIFSVNELRFNN